MKKVIVLLTHLFFLLVFTQINAEEFHKGQLFFKFKQEVNTYNALDLEQRISSKYEVGITISQAFKTQDVRLNRIFLIQFDTAINEAELIGFLKEVQGNEYVEQVPKHEFFYTPNDLLSTQYNLSKIAADQAWNLTKGDTSIVVAVVDDAVSLSHADLAPNIWRNMNEIQGNLIDDDGNGYVDDINGWDAADVDNNPNPVSAASSSYHAHGTHCAGIVSAKTDNNIGIASIGFNLKIMPVKIGAELTLPYPPFRRYIGIRNAYQGVDYAIQNKANVISMSWGRGGTASLTEQIVFNVAYARNIVCVAAAGNSNTSANSYPAAYNHVISVASSTSTDVRSSFSNYGSTIDVTAPGSSIYSTVPGLPGYANKSGTSMACPLVSGICGLMLSINPNLTVDDLETCLENSCDNIDAQNPSFIGDLGAGRVNALAALKCLKPINADFTADKMRVCPRDTVRFADLSVKNAIRWRWSFSGGTPSSDTVQNPVIAYNTSGVFNVQLIVTNTNGSDTLNKAQFITIKKPTAKISGDASILLGGTAFLKFELSGVPVFDVKFTDGKDTFDFKTKKKTYYHPVTPSATTIYTMINASDSNCTADLMGKSKITVNSRVKCTTPSFQIAIGGLQNDIAYAQVELEDSTIVIGGYTSSSGSGKEDILLVRIDNKGQIIWQKTVGGAEDDRLYNLMQDKWGSILGVGRSNNRGYIFKMDTGGNTIWQKTVGASNFHELYDVQQTLDDKYVVLGHQRISISNANSQDLYLLKLDTNGISEWSKKISQGYYQGSKDLTCLSDSSFLITTGTYSGNYDHWLIKIDKTGSAVWGKKGGGAYSETLSSSVQVGNSIYVTDSYRPTSSNLENYIGKFDLNGTLIWGKTFGGALNDRIRSISKTKENYLAISVLSESNTHGKQDGMLVLLDTNGVLIQTNYIGGVQNDYFNEYIETKEGGTVAAGFTESFGSGGSDFYVHKVNCAQSPLCNSKVVSLTINSVVLTYSNHAASLVTGPSIYTASLATKNSLLARKTICNKQPNNSRFCYKIETARKISSDSGNFSGVLPVNSTFGGRNICIGDVDKDGVNDLAVSSASKSYGNQKRGAVWVLLMNNDGSVKKEVEISQNLGGFTGSLGFEEIFGMGLSPLGDFNGDGIPDIAVGSRSDEGHKHAGALWLCYLDTTGRVKSHSKINKLNGGLPPSTLGAYSSFGYSIDTLGDLNKDGVMDLVTGGYVDQTGGANSGAVWILFLNKNGTVKSVKKHTRLTPKLAGLIPVGAGFGVGVSSIGDINNDSVIDVAVTSYNDPTGGSKRGAIIILKLDTSGNILAAKKHTSLDKLSFIKNNGYNFGIDVMGLGDINHDGYNDLMVGAFKDSDGGVNRGAFVYFAIDSFGDILMHKKFSTLNMPSNFVFNNADLFGSSLGLWRDKGDTLQVVVGARTDDDGASNAGSVYIINMIDSCQNNCAITADFSFSSSCPNDTISLADLSIDNNRSIAYWKYDFGDGDSSFGEPNPKHFYKANGNYIVTLIAGSFDNTGACFDTITKNIQVASNLTSLINLSKDTICLYDSTQVNLSINCALEPVKIKWSPSSGLSNDSIVNPKIFSLASQQYIVTITDNLNNIIRDTVMVVVDSSCCRALASFEMDKEIYCLGDTIRTINNSRTKGAVSYVWNFTAPIASQSSAVMQPVVFSTAGSKMIQLILMDDCGTDTFEKEIFIHTLPAADAGKDTVFCLPDTLTIGTNSIANLAYDWSPSATVFNPQEGVSFALPTASITYYLSVIDPFTGCINQDSIQVTDKQITKIQLGNDTSICQYDSIRIGISEVGEYIWNTGEKTQYIHAKSEGSYILNFSQGSCKSADTIGLSLDSIPQFTLGEDIESCGDTTLTLVPSQFRNSYDYTWDDNSIDSVRKVITAGTYWLQIENGKCVSRDSIELKIIDFPETINIGADTLICETDSIRLGISETGNYRWNTGESTQYIYFKGPGNVMLTLSNGKCSISDTMFVATDQIPTFTLGSDVSLCADSTIELKPNQLNSNYTYLWDNGNTDSFRVISDSGLYSLMIQNGACEFSDEIKVNRLNKPTFFSLGQDTIICKEDTLALDAYQGNDFTYLWQDGIQLPSRMVAQKGIYQVDVSNRCGSESASITVDIEDCSCTLYLPTAFTPNSDGLNDVFVPTYCELETFKMEVFNRWGQKVFETEDINKGWDGNANGKKTLGVYFWVITLKSPYQNKGELYYRSGTVNLMSYEK